MQTIGVQSVTQKSQEAALEFRMISSFVAKLGRENFEQRIQQAGYDISGLQFGILRMLAMEGEHSLKELSSKFMLDPSTLVPSVDSLERKRIVTRHRDDNDRRRVVIGLTDTGRTIAHQFHQFSDEDIIYQAMEAMGEEDVEQMMVLLRKLIHHIPEGESIISNICNRMKTSQLGDRDSRP